jgi:opacity protein-like surface antigen
MPKSISAIGSMAAAAMAITVAQSAVAADVAMPGMGGKPTAPSAAAHLRGRNGVSGNAWRRSACGVL